MTKINWKVRLKNKVFWATAIPTVLLLIHQILRMFGVEFDYIGLSEELMDIFNTAFILLGLVGIVNDPTTSGFEDSEQAMEYDKPKGE